MPVCARIASRFPLASARAAFAAAAAREAVAGNMRVGGSDARWFRLAGLPTVVYGPTPHNMGGADEWVSVTELEAIAQVHALAGFDFLNGENGAP
jgi:acetylornithine deacetylase/succinyl-diaminopimelate desuccinylase-like protein